MASALFPKHLNDQLCPVFFILALFLVPFTELSPWSSTLAWEEASKRFRGWSMNRWSRTPRTIFPYFTVGHNPGLIFFSLFQGIRWKEVTRYPQPGMVIMLFPLSKRNFCGQLRWNDSTSIKSQYKVPFSFTKHKRFRSSKLHCSDLQPAAP